MTLRNLVNEALAQWPQPKVFGDRIVIPTHCLTSAGDIVHVTVEGGVRTFYVHDGGTAIRMFEDCGGDGKLAVRTLRSHMKAQGFVVDDRGIIRAPKVELADLAATIVMVANGARDGFEHLLQRWKPAFKKKFKEAVQDILELEFPSRVQRDRTLIGKSNKPHHFDFMLNLSDDRQLVFDAVVHDHNAISAAVLRHLDLANADNEKVVQRIVYDDRVEWRATDLNLLKIGAPPIAFTSMFETIDRLAA